jgi:hypothetical protein
VFDKTPFVVRCAPRLMDTHAPPPGVTSFQQAVLDNSTSRAVEASLAAEAKLLTIFAEGKFRDALAGYKTLEAQALAALPPKDLLRRLDSNLDYTEYTTNFNVTIFSNDTNLNWAVTPTLHDFDTYGFFPNLWQLKVSNAPNSPKHHAVEHTLNVIETELYGLKEFRDPFNPSWDEAAERGQYVFENIHRNVLGADWKYGTSFLVYRNSVIRSRALMVPADSGRWYDMCLSDEHINRGIWFAGRWHKNAWNCSAMKIGAPLGRSDAQLHLFYSAALYYHELLRMDLPSALALYVWELLDPSATLKGVSDQPEVMVLGSVRTSDLKFIAASFPV